MAFTIIPGSGTAPTTYEGTDGSDLAAIQTAPNGVVVRGLGGNDVINWGTSLVSSTLSGGQGNDILTPNIISGATLISGFINGNQGNDTIGNPQLGVSATISTIAGGQGDDTMYAGNLQSSLFNGNLGNDIMTLGVATSATVNTSDSTIFGGQGNDTIFVTDGTAVTGYINSLIDGNLGDDTIIVNLDNLTTLFQNSTIAGGEGDDTINASQTVAQVGLLLDGGAGRDTINGGAGNDVINGGIGEDSLLGGAGSDTINGGNEDDVLNGGANADLLSGGTGSNRFVQRAGSTALPTGFIDAGADLLLNAGDTLFAGAGANGPDIITDWQTGAGTNKIDTGLLGFAVGGAQPLANMSYGATYAIDNNYAIRGNFRVNADGTSQFEVGGLVGVVNTGADIGVFTIQNPGLVGGVLQTSNMTVLLGAGASSLGQSDFVVV